MKRNVLAVIFVLAILVTLGITASAMELRAAQIKPELTFDGTTANCQMRIAAAGKEISATMELWQGSRFIASWSDLATTRLEISESCTVESGLLYTLKVSGTIDGEPFEGTPVSARCLGGLLQ